MTLNADFSRPVLLHADEIDWLASPMPGVHRRMLDRIGGEVARATTIVRYAPGSAFSAHTHGGGEEFIVLDGTFQDEHGDYPAGTYVRNPPTTSHTPGAAEGCTIFVKLWQFDPDDRSQFAVRMADGLGPEVSGIRTALLHEDPRETVLYREMAPGATLTVGDPGGLELLILSGTAGAGADALRKGSWLRLPEGASITLTAGEGGAAFWSKTGHLPYARAPEV